MIFIDTSVIDLPEFPKLERLTLTIAHASILSEDLHRSFSAVRSILSSIDIKHLAVRLDYNVMDSILYDMPESLISECRELESLIMARKLTNIVISIANARRGARRIRLITEAFQELFPTLSRRGLLTILPEVDRTAGHASSVTALAVSADSRFVASVSNGAFVLWDTQTRRVIREWTCSTTNAIHILTFSPRTTDHRLASCSEGYYGSIALWDVKEGCLLAVLGERWYVGRIATCVWSPDGALLAVGREDTVGTEYADVRVWDAETAVELYKCRSNFYGIRSALFSGSPEGRWLVTGSGDGAVRVWDAATGEICVTHFLGKTTNAMVYHPNGMFAMASGASGVRVFKIASRAQRTCVSEEEVFLQAMFPEGEKEPANQTLAWNSRETVAFSQDGTLLLWAAWIDGISTGTIQVKVWDTYDWKLLSRLTIHSDSRKELRRSVSFSPDGKYVAIAPSGNRQVTVWRTNTQDKVPAQTFVEHRNGSASHVAFSPDGAILASGAQDGSVFIRPVLFPNSPSSNHRTIVDGCGSTPLAEESRTSSLSDDLEPARTSTSIVAI
ncbi:transporter [Ganoderma sinense ZZ0214-1]|uniref:Transporter n=1 Tax=Ganoderma sinense ZZ0214-1 TaxID=1077348 RepID=A0A2G8SFB3_9APHY|nr:transporter [Ganoderma sinense ZZ0214-1]